MCFVSHYEVPVLAVSKAPRLIMVPNEIDLGEIFFNKKISIDVKLYNESKTLKGYYYFDLFKDRGPISIEISSPEETGSNITAIVFFIEQPN